VPSPVGHALGGIAISWAIVPRRNRQAALLLAGIAIAPDLDLLVGTHRAASHSVGAAVIAGVVAAIAAPRLGAGSSGRVGLPVALAWASHVLLDWLSNDTRPPIGVMALWPFTHEYFKAAIEIFPPVSRRYWESRFWIYNLRAVASELVLLAPLAALAVWLGQRSLMRPEVRNRR